MVKRELKAMGYLFEECCQKRYGNIYVLPLEAAVVCEFEGIYVGKEDFQKLIGKVSKTLEEYPMQRVILDFRGVEGFYQPSFEWLLTVWKAEMLAKDLYQYRYLLRDEAWYEEMVRLTYRKVSKNNPQAILDRLDIRYCKSFYEALTA